MAVSPLEIPGKILIRGFSITNSKNFPSIVKQLEDKYQDIINAFGFKTLNKLQERILFTLDAGVDLYLTSSELDCCRSTCLFPVLDHVLHQLHEQNLTEQKIKAAPSAIIMCESTRKGLWLKGLLENLLELLHPMETPSGSKVVLLDNVHSEAMLATVAQPLEILILTAGALQEVQSHGFKSNLGLKYHRTRYIVFEELAMKDYFSDKDVIQFLNDVSDKTTRQSVLKQLPPGAQLIFLGTIWHTEYIGSVRKKLCHRARKSVMIFGSSLHALQFSHSITWKLDHVENDKAKLSLLVEICKDMLLEKRNVVVACCSSNVAVAVSKYISETGGICNSVITHGNIATLGVFKKNMDWLGSVFVVADNAWDESVEVDNVSCLVHFDIGPTPLEDSKTFVDKEEPFCLERFSCMWNRMERNWSSSAVELPGLTHLLLSGKEPNFLALHKFLQTVNISLPQSLKEIADQRLQKQSLSKPLCTNFKCFSFCNTIDCPDRHGISQEDLDIQPDVPSYGELEFKVTQSISPSLYVVKLVNHYVFDENTGERICAKAYQKEARERILQMMDYYAIERNRVCPLRVAVAELYSIPFNQQPVQNGPAKSTMFLRAKLAGFIPEHETFINNETAPDYVQVFCVDFGMMMTIPQTHLMILPKQFQDWKPLCIQVVLSNLLYRNEAREYYSDALVQTKQLTEGKVWRGKILLSIRDTVWINPMVQCENDPVTGHLALGCNLFVELFNENFITFQDSYKHMMIMLDYIRKQDPNYPTIEHEMNCLPVLAQHNEKFHNKGDPIKWATLPLTKVDDDHRVLIPVPFTIHLWIDPWEIYGAVCQSESNEAILCHLEEELTREMKRIIAKNKMNMFSSCALEIGSVVAVKISQESRWQRAILLDKNLKEGKACSTFDVFLADYGSMAFNLLEFKQVVPIRKVYVAALPFQAVCLQLAHIQPLNGDTDWKEGDVEQFSSVVGNNATMNVIAFDTLESTCRPCNCYTAMVYRKLKVSTGYAVEEMGVRLVLKECAETTTDLERVCLATKLITANDNLNINASATSSESSSYEESEDFAMTDGDDEGDEDSETSLERWRRFCYVEDDESEYVAVPYQESESFKEEADKTGKINGNPQIEKETLKGSFGKICQNLSWLKIVKVDPNNDDDSLKNQQGGDAEEFYDAVTGEIDESEPSALSLLRQWFMKTL